jgi:hypothetical protein
MKHITLLAFVCLCAGCAAQDAYTRQWYGMWDDMAARQWYEHQICLANRSRLRRDPPKRVAVRRQRDSLTQRSEPERIMVRSNSDTEAQSARITALDQRLQMLEEALKTNASTTNANQEMILGLIRELKHQIQEQQQRPETTSQQQTISAIIPPGK